MMEALMSVRLIALIIFNETVVTWCCNGLLGVNDLTGFVNNTTQYNVPAPFDCFINCMNLH